VPGRDAFIDVLLELNPAAVARSRDSARYVLELSRDVADQKCRVANAELRTDRRPEILTSKAVDPLTGLDVILVASRWAVVAPDSVVPGVAAG
jgi:hypothetical protein